MTRHDCLFHDLFVPGCPQCDSDWDKQNQAWQEENRELIDKFMNEGGEKNNE